MQILRWIFRGVVFVIVLACAIVAAYRWRGPTHAQRDAQALLEKDYRPQGHNAFARLWFMQYEVSDGDLDTAMAADIASTRSVEETATGDFYRSSREKLKEATGDTSGLCERQAKDCLAKIAADPAAARAAVDAFPIMRAREEAFEHSDFSWSEFPATVLSDRAADPGPAQRVWLSAFAVRYVEGDHAGALAGVCRNVATWRRLRGRTNSLPGEMIAIAQTDAGLRLFAQMLAALPRDEAAPPECSDALRPVDAADLDRCAAMAREYAISTDIVREMTARYDEEPWWNRPMAWLTFDARQSLAWRAEQGAAFCGEGALRRMAADLPVAAETLRVTNRFECVASAIGCILAEIVAPTHLQYDQRALDFAAHLRLAATLLWLRDAPAGVSATQRFESRGEALRSGHRNSGVDAATGLLFVENLYTSRETRFELPLAAGIR